MSYLFSIQTYESNEQFNPLDYTISSDKEDGDLTNSIQVVINEVDETTDYDIL